MRVVSKKGHGTPTKPRDHVIRFVNRHGKVVTTAPITKAEAERRMRVTDWSPGAMPKIERVDAKKKAR